MIDHLSIGVRDLTRASTFYDAILLPLGYVRLFTTTRGVGYGLAGDRDEQFALLAVGADARAPAEGCHIAFSARRREAVDAFHVAALREGGADDGPPGLRDKYGPGYYAAFVVDLDGYQVEAVCHDA